MCGSGANVIHKMESMCGQSGNSHPCHLAEQQKSVWLTFVVGMRASSWSSWQASCVVPKVLCELKKYTNYFFGGSSSEHSKISDIMT